MDRYNELSVYGVTLFANLPTGRSVFAGPMGPENIAVTCHDQWGSGIAVTLQKNLRPWTMMLQMKSLRLFADTWSETAVDGFFDSSVQLLLGYNLPFWNLNLNFSATQLELSPRTVTLGSQAEPNTIVSPNSHITVWLESDPEQKLLYLPELNIFPYMVMLHGHSHGARAKLIYDDDLQTYVIS